jgi:hypothetical protein
MHKITQKAEMFFNSRITKYTVFYLILTLLFWVFRQQVNEFIFDHLTINATSFNIISIVLVICLAIFTLVYIFFRIIAKKYNPSLFFKNTIGIFFLAYLILRLTDYNQKWFFIPIYEDFKIIDLFGLNALIFLLV